MEKELIECNLGGNWGTVMNFTVTKIYGGGSFRGFKVITVKPYGEYEYMGIKEGWLAIKVNEMNVCDNPKECERILRAGEGCKVTFVDCELLTKAVTHSHMKICLGLGDFSESL